jgi:hypothetical protein
MSRNLTTAAATAVAAEVVPRALAVALDFTSGMLRLASTTTDLEIDGDTYLGVGALGSISPVEETADLASATLALQLSGIPPDTIAIALAEAYQNRAGTVFEVPLDPDTLLPIADPIVLFRGRMDVMTVQRGETSAGIEVRLTNRLVDWERPRRILFSAEEQERSHPGDTSFAYAASMAEKDVVWPTGDYFKKVVAFN